jgi:hypothetical protein
MIMLWNQKEVFVGCSLQKFNEICQILLANKIQYKYRLVNNKRRRSRTGTFGENMNYAVTYYIYVHKKNYEHICEILKSYL